MSSRYTRYYSQILFQLEFPREIIRKILRYQNFMNIRPVGADVCPCGLTGQIDMRKLIVDFEISRTRLKNAMTVQAYGMASP
jgi:hypothetical protein